MGTTGVLLLSLLLLSGCMSVRSLAETLNERQVMSCIYIMGSAHMFLSARVVAATGGATLKDCKD